MADAARRRPVLLRKALRLVEGARDELLAAREIDVDASRATVAFARGDPEDPPVDVERGSARVAIAHGAVAPPLARCHSRRAAVAADA
jgi:hypothetical protein